MGAPTGEERVLTWRGWGSGVSHNLKKAHIIAKPPRPDNRASGPGWRTPPRYEDLNRASGGQAVGRPRGTKIGARHGSPVGASGAATTD